MGYAIPISYAQSIIEDLMNKKTRTEVVSDEDSSYLGINGQDVSDDMASLYGIPRGIYITAVGQGCPAEDAGLKKGDIIVKFDGTSVTTMAQLKSMLAYYAAGEDVKLVISQAENGEYVEKEVTVTLGRLADYQTRNQ